MHFFPCTETLSIPDSHHAATCCWSKKFDDFWKLSVIMRQTIPFAIKATHPFYPGSWHFPCLLSYAQTISVNKRLCMLKSCGSDFHFCGVVWYGLRIWKGLSNRKGHVNQVQERVEWKLYLFSSQATWQVWFFHYSKDRIRSMAYYRRSRKMKKPSPYDKIYLLY